MADPQPSTPPLLEALEKLPERMAQALSQGPLGAILQRIERLEARGQGGSGGGGGRSGTSQQNRDINAANRAAEKADKKEAREVEKANLAAEKADKKDAAEFARQSRAIDKEEGKEADAAQKQWAARKKSIPTPFQATHRLMGAVGFGGIAQKMAQVKEIMDAVKGFADMLAGPGPKPGAPVPYARPAAPIARARLAAPVPRARAMPFAEPDTEGEAQAARDEKARIKQIRESKAAAKTMAGIKRKLGSAASKAARSAAIPQKQAQKQAALDEKARVRLIRESKAGFKTIAKTKNKLAAAGARVVRSAGMTKKQARREEKAREDLSKRSASSRSRTGRAGNLARSKRARAAGKLATAAPPANAPPPPAPPVAPPGRRKAAPALPVGQAPYQPLPVGPGIPSAFKLTQMGAPAPAGPPKTMTAAQSPVQGPAPAPPKVTRTAPPSPTPASGLFPNMAAPVMAPAVRQEIADTRRQREEAIARDEAARAASKGKLVTPAKVEAPMGRREQLLRWANVPAEYRSQKGKGDPDVGMKAVQGRRQTPVKLAPEVAARAANSQVTQAVGMAGGGGAPSGGFERLIDAIEEQPEKIADAILKRERKAGGDQKEHGDRSSQRPGETESVGRSFVNAAMGATNKGSHGAGTQADDEQRNALCSVLTKLVVAAI